MKSLFRLALLISFLFIGIIQSNAQGSETWRRMNDLRLEFTKAVRFSGDITPDTLDASANNYSPEGLSNASIIRLRASTAVNVTGLALGSKGKIIFIWNIGSAPITFKDESASSTAANRFALARDIVLYGDEPLMLQYDATASRWRIFNYRIPGEQMIGKLLTANLNVTTDQAIPIVQAKKFVITKIVVTNASVDISGGSTAGGVYPSASKAGTAIVANSQVYTALSASTKYQSLTLASVTNTDVYTSTSIYFSLTTAFGSACTADIYVYGYVLEQ